MTARSTMMVCLQLGDNRRDSGIGCDLSRIELFLEGLELGLVRAAFQRFLVSLEGGISCKGRLAGFLEFRLFLWGEEVAARAAVFKAAAAATTTGGRRGAAARILGQNE